MSLDELHLADCDWIVHWVNGLARSFALGRKEKEGGEGGDQNVALLEQQCIHTGQAFAPRRTIHGVHAQNLRRLSGCRAYVCTESPLPQRRRVYYYHDVI